MQPNHRLHTCFNIPKSQDFYIFRVKKDLNCILIEKYRPKKNNYLESALAISQSSARRHNKS